MKITIEMIDELRKRANVSFEDAKDALEKCEGDLLEALIYLEKNKKFSGTNYENKHSFFDKIKSLIKKGNSIRFIIRRKERTILNLSLTASIIIAALTIHISPILLIIMLFLGFKFRLERSNGEGMKVNETINKVQDGVDNLKRKLAEDASEEVNK